MEQALCARCCVDKKMSQPLGGAAGMELQPDGGLQGNKGTALIRHVSCGFVPCQPCQCQVFTHSPRARERALARCLVPSICLCPLTSSFLRDRHRFWEIPATAMEDE